MKPAKRLFRERKRQDTQRLKKEKKRNRKDKKKEKEEQSHDHDPKGLKTQEHRGSFCVPDSVTHSVTGVVGVREKGNGHFFIAEDQKRKKTFLVLCYQEKLSCLA